MFRILLLPATLGAGLPSTHTNIHGDRNRSADPEMPLEARLSYWKQPHLLSETVFLRVRAWPPRPDTPNSGPTAAAD